MSESAETGDLKDFETQFARLQAIVSELESGSLSLDQGMTLYREGIRCSRSCKTLLENARHELHKWQNGEEVELNVSLNVSTEENGRLED